MDLGSARFRDPSFVASKLLGWSFNSLADLVNPEFLDCRLNYSNFVGLNLKKTQFKSCQLIEVDFAGTDLTESTFEGSDLLRARFANTKLTKADFSGATRYLINPLENQVKGARFSMPEAQGLLTALGVVIV